MNMKIDPSFSRYVNEAKRFPMLSLEREQALAIAWRDHGDRAALDQLISSHLRLVIKTAWSFKRYGVPIADLVSEGNIGLMQAAGKFDPQRGFRFATYAIWWVRAAIQKYILDSWSLVKIGNGRAQKKLFFNLRRLKAHLHAFEGGDLQPETVAAIANDLDVPEGEVVEMNRRLGARDDSLNAMLGSEGGRERLELLSDERPGQETAIGNIEERGRRRDLLESALTKLNPREREIVVKRRLIDEPVTLGELSQRYAVSRERIRQIEFRAVEKLRQAMLDPAQTMRASADLVSAA
jgi:RNA polymerase sigma-32 factor